MSRPAPSSSYGLPFWVAVAVGCAVMGWGVSLFLDAVGDPARRLDFVVWVVGSDLVHDLVVAPIVVGVGWCIARAVPAGGRPAVQVATIVSAAVLVVAWLPLRGSARHAGNPTIQPLDYRTATLTALGLVWGATGVWALWQVRRARRAAQEHSP